MLLRDRRLGRKEASTITGARLGALLTIALWPSPLHFTEARVVLYRSGGVLSEGEIVLMRTQQDGPVQATTTSESFHDDDLDLRYRCRILGNVLGADRFLVSVAHQHGPTERALVSYRGERVELATM